ncbi:MAG: MotA/TolQ/ExbB proton channel family protein [Alphaproteobacteria bacterium]|nr:MotA/TolQ/ExbB proton channel family protein [Alphaproteobacteria bacterium]
MELPSRYITRMFLFLVLVTAACAVLFPALKNALMTNPPLNSLIILVFLFGVFLNFHSVFALYPEIKWVKAPVLSLSEPDLQKLRLLSPLALVLKNNQAKGNAVLSPTIARTILDSVGMRLEESRDISKYIIGLSTFLGLLGTFWGLMSTVGAVADVIRSLNISGEEATQAFNTIKNSLELPLSGMGTAFSSSLLGLSGALVVGFLDLQASRAQNNFYNSLDEYLASLTRYSSSVGSQSDESVTSNGAYANALLEQVVESLADIRNQLKKAEAQGQERTQTDMDMLRFISRIDHNVTQIDKRSEARQETLLTEVRDSFRLLVRTISGKDKQ